jgi:hypothetical protein
MSTRGRADVSSSQNRSQGGARVDSSGHGAGCGSSRFSSLRFFFFFFSPELSPTRGGTLELRWPRNSGV